MEQVTAVQKSIIQREWKRMIWKKSPLSSLWKLYKYREVLKERVRHHSCLKIHDMHWHIWGIYSQKMFMPFKCHFVSYQTTQCSPDYPRWQSKSQMWSGWRPGETPSIPPRGITWSVNVCRSASRTLQQLAASSPSLARQPTSSLLSSLTRTYKLHRPTGAISSKCIISTRRCDVEMQHQPQP